MCPAGTVWRCWPTRWRRKRHSPGLSGGPRSVSHIVAEDYRVEQPTEMTKKREAESIVATTIMRDVDKKVLTVTSLSDCGAVVTPALACQSIGYTLCAQQVHLIVEVLLEIFVILARELGTYGLVVDLRQYAVVSCQCLTVGSSGRSVNGEHPHIVGKETGNIIHIGLAPRHVVGSDCVVMCGRAHLFVTLTADEEQQTGGQYQNNPFHYNLYYRSRVC